MPERSISSFSRRPSGGGRKTYRRRRSYLSVSSASFSIRTVLPRQREARWAAASSEKNSFPRDGCPRSGVSIPMRRTVTASALPSVRTRKVSPSTTSSTTPVSAADAGPARSPRRRKITARDARPLPWVPGGGHPCFSRRMDKECPPWKVSDYFNASGLISTFALFLRSERKASSIAFFFCSATCFRRPAFFSAHSASEGSCSPENATATKFPSRPWYTFRETGDFAERVERSFRRSPTPASARGPVPRGERTSR